MALLASFPVEGAAAATCPCVFRYNAVVFMLRLSLGRPLMSTVPRPSKRPRAPTEADPFFYGWRDVWQANGHGGKTLVRLPLTEEDILHPQEGDFVVQNTPHDLD